MKHLSILSILFIALFTQCTIEKRLYNRGFYVERNRIERSETQSQEKSSDKPIIGKEERTLDFRMEEVDLESDTVLMVEESLSDSVVIEEAHRNGYPRQPREAYTNEIQKQKLISTGCLTALWTICSVLCYINLITETQTFALILAGFGWIGFLILAVTFGIAFLVYLFRPTVEDQEKRTYSGIREQRFSDGEKFGIVVASIFGFAILLALILPAIME